MSSTTTTDPTLNEIRLRIALGFLDFCAEHQVEVETFELANAIINLDGEVCAVWEKRGKK